MADKKDKFDPYTMRPEKGNLPDSWAYPTRSGGKVYIVIRDQRTGHTVGCDVSRQRLTKLAAEMTRRIKHDRGRRKR